MVFFHFINQDKPMEKRVPPDLPAAPHCGDFGHKWSDYWSSAQADDDVGSGMTSEVRESPSTVSSR